MKKNPIPRLVTFSSVLILILILLSSCNRNGTQTPSATPIPPTPQSSPTPTNVPARLVLYDPINAVTADVDALLADFSSANALTYEKTSTLGGNFIGVKVAVLISGPDNLQDLAAASPETQFILIGNPTLESVSNLSVLETKPGDLAFMAGFLSAVTAEDWRSGGLLVDDGSSGAVGAFENGARLMCGQCSPKYPPFIYYPDVETLAVGSDLTAWTTQVETLLANKVDTIYIDPALDQTDLVTKFELTGAAIYGGNPVSEDQARYTAILSGDILTGLQTLLPQVLAGEGGKTIPLKVVLAVINDPVKVSPGKQDFFNRVAQDLFDGWINPLTVN
jgi:hypothetical protein